MTALKRTQVGKFLLKDALDPTKLTAEHMYKRLRT